MSSEKIPRIIRCPTCGKSSRYDATNPDRPFCSHRCKINDTAKWADESFRIPVHQNNPEEEESIEALLAKRPQDEDSN